MADLDAMQIFATVVEEKSFSAAAAKLMMSTPVVSRRVSRLEKSLGTRLLNRTTRQLSLTEAGATFYEYCRKIVQDAEKAEQLMSELQAEPRGKLRISAPSSFGPLHIAPGLPDFLSRYPHIDVDLKIFDHHVQLAEDGYEIVIRMGQEPGLNEVGRRLGPLRKVVCASPDYLDRHGTPQKPEDVASHNCLIYFDSRPEDMWQFQAQGRKRPVHVEGNLCVNNTEVIRHAALAGLGLAFLPTYAVSQDLQSGALRALLLAFTPPVGDIYAVYLPNNRISPRVRAFIDFFMGRIGCPPCWDQIAPLTP